MKIVCIGDSFTRGYGVNKKESWLNLVSEAFPHHTFVNKGVNGDTTGGMLARFYSDVISEKPRYVLIMGGANDFICSASLSSVQSNIMAMVHQAYHNNIVPILGIEPECIPDMIPESWAALSDFNEVKQKLLELQRWSIRFCSAFHVDSIDFFEGFPNLAGNAPLREYYSDGLHLTPAGHEVICGIVKDFFNRSGTFHGAR